MIVEAGTYVEGPELEMEAAESNGAAVVVVEQEVAEAGGTGGEAVDEIVPWCCLIEFK